MSANLLRCLLVFCTVPPTLAALPGGCAAQDIWFDPAWTSADAAGQPARATVWFDRQLIGEGDAYVRRTRELADARRRALRTAVLDSLHRLSDASWAEARPSIERLQREGRLGDCRRHWIVNGFTCTLPAGDPAVLGGVPGIARVYRAGDAGGAGQAAAAVTFADEAATSDAWAPDAARASWNARHLGIDRVWSEHGLTGRGVLHVIHDFGWTFAPPPIRATLWRNPGEVAANGVDDDGNGLVDDVHGFNFDRGDADLSPTSPLLPGNVTHGDVTAAVAAGREAADTALTVGGAPASRWAAVISSLDVSPAVEWALEIGADTYSMSFSRPGLGEMRAHWRKVMDHAALAGLFNISGAGNFANPDAPTYAPVPVQMRTPEDIPFSVFGVSGVGQNGQRPVFSSQGPVEWRTSAYAEGRVDKPDLATINADITIVDEHGRASRRDGQGWAGNSFAGPHLAAVIALMLEADPDLTPWQARDILVATARDLAPAGPDPQTGAGVVDAFAAVSAVKARKSR